MRSDGMSARRPRPLGTRHEGIVRVTATVGSSFLEPPAPSFLRARDHTIGKGPWKLIGIGGHLAMSPLPHHRAYGSVPRRFGQLSGHDFSR